MLRFWSKITPKLRKGEFVVNVWVDAESKLRELDGSGTFLLSDGYKYEFILRMKILMVKFLVIH